MPPKFDAADYEHRLRALVAQAKTCTGAATTLGVHYRAVRRMANELGIDFRKSGKGHKETPMTRWKRRIQQMSARELKANPPSVWA